MCSKEHLIGYLYGEQAADERAAFEAHISECADCREEVDQLRLARQHLASWSPPEPEINFSIVQTRTAAAPPRRRLAFVPQWGLAAAAALLVIAGAAAIANVEMRYGPEGFVVRTGWAAPPADTATGRSAAAATATPAATTPASEQMARQLTALAERLRDLEVAQQQQITKASASGSPVITASELRKILTESEARQRTELAVSIAQVWNDFNAARATDFERLRQVVNNAQGVTNAQLMKHSESINYLRLASQR